MKLKDISSEVYQRFGLWVINSIARSADYVVDKGVRFGDHSRHTLDHYQLKGSNNPATVLFFYGGNWRSGRKQDYRFVADTLLKSGFNVIVPDYRLYPLVRFGDIRADAIKALECAAELVGDSDLYLMGHSAGAQLAALLSLDSSLSNSHGRIRGCVGLSGPYDFYPFTDDDHWDLFGPASSYPESQAVNYVSPDAPPLYLLHGADDARVRRGHSKSLMEKQQAAGGAASREVYPGLGHADLIVQFSRLHRGNAAVVLDVQNFINKMQDQSAQDLPHRLKTEETAHGA